MLHLIPSRTMTSPESKANNKTKQIPVGSPRNNKEFFCSHEISRFVYFPYLSQTLAFFSHIRTASHDWVMRKEWRQKSYHTKHSGDILYIIGIVMCWLTRFITVSYLQYWWEILMSLNLAMLIFLTCVLLPVHHWSPVNLHQLTYNYLHKNALFKHEAMWFPFHSIPTTIFSAARKTENTTKIMYKFKLIFQGSNKKNLFLFAKGA